MQTVLIAIQLVVSVALVVVVLLQRSEGGALGIGGGGGGGGGMGGLFSPRGAADTLTRTTVILGIVFFLTSIALTLYSLHGGGQRTSILDSAPVAPVSAPAAPAKVPAQRVPAVPKPQ